MVTVKGVHEIQLNIAGGRDLRRVWKSKLFLANKTKEDLSEGEAENSGHNFCKNHWNCDKILQTSASALQH